MDCFSAPQPYVWRSAQLFAFMLARAPQPTPARPSLARCAAVMHASAAAIASETARNASAALPAEVAARRSVEDEGRAGRRGRGRGREALPTRARRRGSVLI